MTPTEALCPPHLCASIEAYVQDGRPVGGFLRAVLENDLVGAVTRADDDNLPALPSIVYYVANNVPIAAWGSVKIVEAWIARCRTNRKQAEREERAAAKPTSVPKPQDGQIPLTTPMDLYARGNASEREEDEC